jgi:hypothetical protein
MAPDDASPLSFESVCAVLDLDPGYVAPLAPRLARAAQRRRKTGFRFSLNARGPSRASSLWKTFHP